MGTVVRPNASPAFAPTTTRFVCTTNVAAGKVVAPSPEVASTLYVPGATRVLNEPSVVEQVDVGLERGAAVVDERDLHLRLGPVQVASEATGALPSMVSLPLMGTVVRANASPACAPATTRPVCTTNVPPGKVVAPSPEVASTLYVPGATRVLNEPSLVEQSMSASNEAPSSSTSVISTCVWGSVQVASEATGALPSTVSLPLMGTVVIPREPLVGRRDHEARLHHERARGEGRRAVARAGEHAAVPAGSRGERPGRWSRKRCRR